MYRVRDFSKLVGPGATAIIGVLEVPSCAKIKLLVVGNYCNNQGAWGALIWSVRKNGVPIFPYDEMLDPTISGALSSQAEGIEYQGGDVLDVIGINNFGVGVKMGIALGFDQS